MIKSIDYSELEKAFSTLRIKMTVSDFTNFSMQKDFSAEQICSVIETFSLLAKRKEQASINFLLKCSRLPLKNPKTFDNFRFEDIKGRDSERLKSLSTLAALHSHKNLAFIGPAGTGKTHLAMAFAYECCCKMLKAYFIKMTELNELFTEARKLDRVGKVMTSLVQPSCLVIDEVGHCVFDAENTRLFFDLVDRRYNKEGSYNMIFTSNKQPSAWRQNFTEEDSLLCALDRIFDDALIFNFNGETHRGLKKEVISLTTKRAKTVALTEQSENNQ